MDDTKANWHKSKHQTVIKNGGSSSVWFLGFVGSLFYFLHVHSGTVWLVILAIVKSLVWPAILVYNLYTYLHL